MNRLGNPRKSEESSTGQKLDRIDMKILRLLQQDGRLSNAELALRANVSAATCHRRTQRLFQEGFVRAVRAEVDPQRVGRGALVMVGVVLDRSTRESFAAFELAAKKLSFVLDCHLVAGDFDYFLKIRLRDMSEFSRLHGEALLGLPGVRQTRTFFVIKEVVDNAPLDF
ncbi:Lrp/AsnC ligand binding domain-containing protein [Mesorhizobium sp. WSM2239]|uniref:Lrp/AsnC ligand binding domain-containing protein n=2 Tax=unclassified Mesorhizobium TaxID=325217 RepID=A0AAU8D9R7_9HYPH